MVNSIEVSLKFTNPLTESIVLVDPNLCDRDCPTLCMKNIFPDFMKYETENNIVWSYITNPLRTKRVMEF